MSRKFEDWDNIVEMDFVKWEEGYHICTITGHKEDTYKNAKGIDRDVDIFEITSDTGATSRITLYYTQNALWTYKRLMKACGINVGGKDINLNFDNLIGKRLGTFCELEEVEKWDEEKKETVLRYYPRFNEFHTEQETLELMEKYNKAKDSFKRSSNKKSKEDDMTPVLDNDEIPF